MYISLFLSARKENEKQNIVSYHTFISLPPSELKSIAYSRRRSPPPPYVPRLDVDWLDGGLMRIRGGARSMHACRTYDDRIRVGRSCIVHVDPAGDSEPYVLAASLLSCKLLLHVLRWTKHMHEQMTISYVTSCSCMKPCRPR